MGGPVRQLTHHRKPIEIDHTRGFNALFYIAVGLAVCAVAFQAWTWGQNTLALANAGRTACEQRFHPAYLDRCNIQVDGLSCSYANRSRLKDWYDEVDYACSQVGPQRPLIAPVTPHEGPSLKPQEVAERS